MKFYMKLEALKGQKLTKTHFLKNYDIGEKIPKFLQNSFFFVFPQKLTH